METMTARGSALLAGNGVLLARVIEVESQQHLQPVEGAVVIAGVAIIGLVFAYGMLMFGERHWRLAFLCELISVICFLFLVCVTVFVMAGGK
jgi:hypothetical protein